MSTGTTFPVYGLLLAVVNLLQQHQLLLLPVVTLLQQHQLLLLAFN
jgi:hypothetical protein